MFYWLRLYFKKLLSEMWFCSKDKFVLFIEGPRRAVKIEEHKYGTIQVVNDIGEIYLRLILTACQPVKGYFMPRGKEIIIVVGLFLDFCWYFLKGVRHSTIRNVLGEALNCIWWWVCYGYLGKDGVLLHCYYSQAHLAPRDSISQDSIFDLNRFV